MPAKRLLQLALAAALLCGLMQNGARLLARLTAGRPLDHGVHAWWMTPLGDALLFVPLALALLALGGRFRRARTVSLQASVLAFPFVLTGLMLGSRLHVVAQLLLAAGVAVRLGTWAARIDPGRRLTGITTALLAITLVVAAPVALWPVLQERRDNRALTAPVAGAPNVLLLIWDTVRASSLGLYGHERETAPFLTALARSGVVFDRAFGTASYTLPSHSSLFTGRWAHELSSNWRVPLNTEPTTLAEVFASAGYRTGGFSANRIYVTREFGLGRGFSHFDEHRLGFQQVVRSSTLLRAVITSTVVRDLLAFDDDLARVHASDNHKALVRWLERDRERPYFAFVNFMEAHTPYLPRPPFAHRFGWYPEGATRRERRSVQVVARREPEQLPPADALHAMRAYEGSIAELDAAVAEMLDDLRSRGLLENTMIIVAADHGEEFGEHAIFGHGNSLYAASLHVPLVMVFPGKVPGGGRVGAAVSLRDVPATILDLTGLAARLPGSSLRALWENPAARPLQPVLSELRYDPRLAETSQAAFGDLASAADDSMQVIRRGDRIEVFNLAADPMGITPGDSTSEHFARLRSSLPRPRSGTPAGRDDSTRGTGTP